MVADNSEETRGNYQQAQDYSHPIVNNSTTRTSNEPVSENTTTTRQTQTRTEEYRPLNVKDALTYLDKVKAKFSTNGQVYNQFLDIMKDFKSQILDTPGVIERVSTLFRGHPILIQGFNTFLPPGYCIECSTDDQSRNIIKVTTPQGITTISESEQVNLNQQPSISSASPSASASASATGTAATTSPTATAADEQQNKAKSPIEFNHAITYVNKIKNRFVNQPETYKKFLEILQTYQKDQKPIEAVYAEVKILFNGSNELLDEFKQFLPEPSKQTRKKRYGNIPTLGISKRTKHHHKTDLQESDVRSPSTSSAAQQPTEEQGVDLARPTFSAEEAEFFEKVKTYIGNRATYNAFLKVLNLFSQQIVDQNVLVSRVESFIGGNKELFDWFKSLVGYDGGEGGQEEESDVEDVTMSSLRSSSVWTNNHMEQRKNKRKESMAAVGCGPSYRHTPKAWQNRSCSGRDALCWDVLNDTYISHPTWASEDTGFVAAKKNQYEEALHRVEEERYDYDLNIEANLNTIALLEPIAKKISIMSPDEKASFRLSPGLGSLPSSRTIYQRILKKIYGVEKGLEMIELLHNNPAQTVPIVLKRLKQKDDEWKRAQREWNKIWREVEIKNYWKSLDYQGILFKMMDRKAMTTKALVAQVEQLRADQQMNRVMIESTSGEAAAAAVTTTTEITKPQLNYTFKDAAVFKDVSRLIYFFLTRQPVYNPEDCESMRAFMNTMIPYFFDVQDVEPSSSFVVEGGVVASNGGSNMIMEEVVEGDEDDKSSIQSMESSSQEQATTKKQQRGGSRRPGGARRGGRGAGAGTGALVNDDDGLLKDVLTRNLKKPKESTSSDDDEEDEVDEDSEQDSEQENDEEDMNSQIGDEDIDEEIDDEDSEQETTTARRPRRRAAAQAAQAAAARNARRHKKRVAALEKQKEQQKKKPQLEKPKMATVASLIEKEISSHAHPPSENIHIDTGSAAADSSSRGGGREERTYNFFGDNAFYCFFRLYQILYDRLYKMKLLDEEFKKHPEKQKRASEEAHELGITPRKFKTSLLKKVMQKDNNRNSYYSLLLALIDKLFEGDVDQQTFEESVRYTFGADAHIMFTIDKLVLSLVRHIHIIIADTQSQELYQVFKNEHKAQVVDQGDLVTYQTRVAGIIDANENTYHIHFKLKSRTFGIQLLDGKNNTISSQAQDGCGGYDKYVSNYIDWANETKGIDQLLLTPRFLKRNLKYKGHQIKDISVRSGMQYKICRDTYHMFYIIGTEDAFVRRQSQKTESPSTTRTKWRGWLNNQIQDKSTAEKEALALLE